MSHPANDHYFESKWEYFQQIPILLEEWQTGCDGDENQCSELINQALNIYEDLLEFKIDNPEFYEELKKDEWGWCEPTLMRQLKRLRNK